MSISTADIEALWLTLKLALVVTVILLVICSPLAWWLATTERRIRHVVNALVALPLVLPPSVLGFYLLIAMGPQGIIGEITAALNLPSLAFSFWGLVIASIIYSLPFVVQPLQNGFQSLGKRPFEVAATLGAKRLDTFFNIALPLNKPAYLTASVLGFAHTVGEFGVVLMIGGNIAGETRVASVQIYDHVESLNYAQAHSLSLILIALSFFALLSVYTINRSSKSAGIR